MAIKLDVLATAVFFIFFVLIANAYSEEGINKLLTNETPNLSNSKNEIDYNGNAEIASEQSNAEKSQNKNNEKNGKPAAASFGVYLNIAG